MIDLHSHTNESDGSFSPQELIEAAVRADLRSLAITDHDTFAGYDAAVPFARSAGIDLIRGIEVSSRDGKKSIHILGYFLNTAPPNWFTTWLREQLRRRKNRNIELAAKLTELGLNITLEEAELLGRTVTGRVHFAQILVQKNYASSIQDAFNRYLGESGSAFVEMDDPATEDVVGRLHKAGAISSVAHLGRYGLTPDQEERFVERLQAAGLNAIEVVHTDHSSEDIARYSALAVKYGLLATGGSDFHGRNKPGVRLGHGNAGKTVIPSEWLTRLRHTKLALETLRENYTQGELLESEVSQDPLMLFQQWFDEAEQAEIREVNSMALATVSSTGSPSVRMVLLKGVDTGFLFYTNYTSQKGQELDQNPQAALCFHWKELERQVRITGTVIRVSREESSEYFQSRPRGSQLGAWASPQSQSVPDRTVLEKKFAEVEQSYTDQEIPLPDHWGGYRLLPQTIEFWQGRPNRLHDRLQYQHSEKGWVLRRLAP